MAILGQLNGFTHSGEQKANTTTHRHSSEGRQRECSLYWHRGYRVCRTTFLFLHSISEKKLKTLKSSLHIHGLTPRNHGNSKRLPANTINFADTQVVVQFINAHAETNAILLPRRIPGYKRSDLQLLPSSTTKRNVWLLYSHSLPVTRRKVA